MNRLKSLLIIAALSTAFIGCGSSDSDSSSSNLSFPTSSVEAEPTIENGEMVKNVVAQNQESTYSINAVSTSSNQNAVLMLKKINDIVKEKLIFTNYSLNEAFSSLIDCTDGGSVSYSVSQSETGEAAMSTTMDNCSEYGMILDGAMEVSMSDFNDMYDDYLTTSIKFTTDYTVTMNDVISSKIQQGSSMIMEVSDITDFYTANNMKLTIDLIMEAGAMKIGQENAVYYFIYAYGNDYSTSMYQTSGRIYINNLVSYVDYDTSYDMSQTPFIFSYYGGLDSGEARYNMANGAKVKIVSEDGEAITYVDVDGDGTYELREQI